MCVYRVCMNERQYIGHRNLWSSLHAIIRIAMRKLPNYLRRHICSINRVLASGYWLIIKLVCYTVAIGTVHQVY